MVIAKWNGQTIAQANNDDVKIVEGNYYFPPTAIDVQFFQQNNHHTTCPWKGEASYYDVVVDNQKNANAAWYYPNPKPEASAISGYVAFWRGVQVESQP
jgi:uncharacterized protein (DUF427 family)